jgi:hypothetical protein
MSVNKQVKDNWDDSSDEEIEEVQAVQVPNVNIRDNCKDCYVCNHDIENDTSYYPQCENKALLDRMKEMDECSSDEEDDEGGEGDYPPEEEGGEGDYPPEEEYDSEGSYDDECDAMDKKMGNYVMCR